MTNAGNSVCCNVYNFLPYFYALPLPESALTESNIPEFQAKISAAVTSKIQSSMKSVPYHDMTDKNSPIISVELLNLDDEYNIFDFFQNSKQERTFPISGGINGLHSGTSFILKITCRVPK